MEKGYYTTDDCYTPKEVMVAIHNKNGKGLLPIAKKAKARLAKLSQSTIKMEKGYYIRTYLLSAAWSCRRNPQ